jgi:hypothetical protein
MATWEDKANQIIADMSADAYRAANIMKNGRKRKHHVPYTLPETALALVECLGTNDEERAKHIFQRIAHGLPGEE